MMKDKTIEMSSIKYIANKSHYNFATALCKKSSCEKIFSQLNVSVMDRVIGNRYTVCSRLSLLHLCHAISHPFQLHGSTHQVKLAQAGNVSTESLLSTWFYLLAHQGVINP